MRGSLRHIDGWAKLCTLVGTIMIAMLGCAVSSRVSTTERSSGEQLLLVRSLERAISQIDMDRFNGKRVALEVHGLTKDDRFGNALLVSRFREQGVGLTAKGEKADLEVKIFLTALGVDRGESLVGIPAFGAPIVGVPVPEVALFKSVQNRGHTELQIFAFDGDEGDSVGRHNVVHGKAKYNDYTLLVLINFNLSDLDGEAADEIVGY